MRATVGQCRHARDAIQPNPQRGLNTVNIICPQRRCRKAWLRPRAATQAATHETPHVANRCVQVRATRAGHTSNTRPWHRSPSNCLFACFAHPCIRHWTTTVTVTGASRPRTTRPPPATHLPPNQSAAAHIPDYNPNSCRPPGAHAPPNQLTVSHPNSRQRSADTVSQPPVVAPRTPPPPLSDVSQLIRTNPGLLALQLAGAGVGHGLGRTGDTGWARLGWWTVGPGWC